MTLYSRNSHYEPNPFWMILMLISSISLAIALAQTDLPNRQFIIASTVITTPTSLVIAYATGKRIYHRRN